MMSSICLALVSILMILQLQLVSVAAYQCLDESGLPVDWYAALSVVGGSWDYYYMDSKTASQGLKLSPYLLNSTAGGAIMNTVSVLYDPSLTADQTAFVM